jgi:AraC-like DNA-binding protein
MSVDWFHFQLESLYLEKTLKSASCVTSFDIQKLASFLHVFDKLHNFFLNRSSVQEERISILEIQSLIQFIIARMIDEKRIDISVDNHNINRLIPALDYINENYRSNVSLAELAELCHYSPNYFNRLFRSTLNMTPLNYIQKRRMEDATRLLVYTDKQVKEVARETGYEDPAYFSRLFVQTYKMSPGSYRINKQRKMP